MKTYLLVVATFLQPALHCLQHCVRRVVVGIAVDPGGYAWKSLQGVS